MGWLRESKDLPDLVPWVEGVGGDQVIRCRDDSLLATWQVEPYDLSSWSADEQGQMILALNNAWKRLRGRWGVWCDTPRGRACLASGEDQAVHAVPTLLERTHRSTYDPSLWTQDFYLSLWRRPPRFPLMDLLGEWLYPSTSQTPQVSDDQTFLAECAAIIDVLRPGVRQLTPVCGTALSTYFHQLVSDQAQTVAWPLDGRDLNYALTDTHLETGLTPLLGKPWVAVVSLKRPFPPQHWTSMLRDLHHLPFSFRQTVVWMHHEAETNRRDFTNQQKKHASKKWRFGDAVVSWATRQQANVLTDSFVEHQEKDTDAARFDLLAQEVTYGDCVFTMILQHEDHATLEAQVQEVTRVIRGCQLTAVVERANAAAAMLNSWPGKGLENPRHFKLSSMNGLHLFSAWSTPWAGQPQTTALHAPALCLMKTETCMPFWLSLHVGDVGHSLCFAPSGAGKSTLMAFLVCQWLSRYPGARVFYLDVKRAARSMFLCLEAPYLDFARDQINLQPLGRVHEAHERAWALDWLLDLVVASGQPRTPTVERFIEWGLLDVAALSPRERTLSALRAILPRRYAPRRAEGVSSAELEHARREQMAVIQSLERYTGRGSYGYALDGDHDDLTDAPIQGFELLGLLETPRLIDAVTSYLGHRFYQGLTGAPTLMVCDEAGQYLIHDGFRRQIDALLRLGRDKKLALLIGTQEATDVLDNRLKTLLVNQCVTRLYPPNANALTGAARPAYDALGLGEPAITRISRATAKRDVYVQQQGVGEQLAHLSLSPVELAVCGSSSTESHTAMDTILAEYGPHGFAERWLTHQGLPQDAERLRQIRKELHGTADPDRARRPSPRAVVPVLVAAGD
jgi:hypothetical protein